MNTTLAPPLLLFVVLSGCGGNAARDRALESAAAARARGDLVGEVEAMRQACQADPKNGDLCQKSGALAEYARGQTRAAAQASCGLLDAQSPATIDGCVAALAPMRRLFPDDPDALRMADAAGDTFAAVCGVAAPADIRDAIRRARCAQAGDGAIATTRFHAWVTTTRSDVARLLVAAADRDDVVQRPGARAATLSAAACLTGTADLRDASAQASRAFAESNAPTLHVRAKGMSAAELCAATSGKLGDRLACVAAPDSRTVVLEASVEVGSVRHAVDSSTRTERYLAGIDRYENPEYPVRARDEMRSREHARDSEATYRAEQQVCDEADAALTHASYCYDCPERTARDSACRRAEDAKALWEDREADWQRARSSLDQTPAILEHEDWRDTSFVVHEHGWSAPWEASIRALPGALSHASGSAWIGDTEHDGSSLAGVAADPLTRPEAGWYVPQVRSEVGARLATLAKTELAARVTLLRSQCPSETPAWNDAAWLDCYATAILISGDAGLGDGLLRAEHAAFDRDHGPGLPALGCN
jgi:hypothetical protein